MALGQADTFLHVAIEADAVGGAKRGLLAEALQQRASSESVGWECATA